MGFRDIWTGMFKPLVHKIICWCESCFTRRRSLKASRVADPHVAGKWYISMFLGSHHCWFRRPGINGGTSYLGYSVQMWTSSQDDFKGRTQNPLWDKHEPITKSWRFDNITGTDKQLCSLVQQGVYGGTSPLEFAEEHLAICNTTWKNIYYLERIFSTVWWKKKAQLTNIRHPTGESMVAGASWLGFT